MTTDPNYGRLVANRYQLVKLIGKGAMGRVYQAKDMLLGGVIVAVKFLSQTLLTKKMRDRFYGEATICAMLGEQSSHIVRVRDYGVDENEVSFYVMEYLEGDSLSEIIRRQPLALSRFLSMSRQICSGLQTAHRGIVRDGTLSPVIHRDIKPSNILVIQPEDDSLEEKVKILDFGIAKLLQSDGDQTHSFMGTLAYCSPEQMEGKELDKRSDIYSLGVMMFEMLTGEMPILGETHSFGGWYKAHHEFPPRSFESVNPDLKLPKHLKKLVLSCLAKDPNHRPQSVEEILRVLKSIQECLKRGEQLVGEWGGKVDELPPPNPPTQERSRSADEICRATSWPKDKPQATIVFPHILKANNEPLATLWVMLNKKDIQDRLVSTRYNQFLFLPSPHPIVLWITVLHNREHGARWLPCYLDLKTDIGQKMVRLLGEAGSYRLLFFALSEPHQCAKVMTSNIAPAQCKLLKDWANSSQTSVSSGQSQLTKRILKQEFEKLKPKILLKLEAIHTDSPTDISG
ncbi:serine/threonine protein kinase [Microcoleus sp. FACHB-53]|jgi:serine/threonine-protein kinase|nr:serine/threonine protein kinase [Microcoleus sp. FACHB-53]MBD2126422.1 serine/threonine protein kinase [Microcoleus sp. FACHB-1]